ncbi:MAG: SusF/SusE family outer membrane protein [Bacteroidota bacterium]
MLKRLLFSLVLFAFATTFASAQITSVGLIGTATPIGDFDTDVDMTQDPNDADVWTLSVTLTTGEAKFRADDDWGVNWGETSFPTGTGVQDGDNIPVAGGPYDITFNSATGEYTFTSTATQQFENIGIIGTATPIGDFMTDVDMTQDSAVPWVFTIEIALTADEVKFRADDLWTDNWGGDDFPAGVAVAGAGNIKVSAPGDYRVTFNTASLEYNFEPLIPIYNTIGLIGTATPGSDTVDTDLTQNPNDPSLWSANMTLTDGWAKFRAEDDWTVNWGADSFPTGTGSINGDNIPVVAGEYNVNFNSATGEYSFDPPINIFNSIGVIGTGTGLGLSGDIDMYQDPAQPDQWSVELKLVSGSIKFRADNDWTINWGDDGFPTGTGVQGGPDIPVFDGTWEIAFNATTGVYSLTPITIGIVGPASPSLSWDVDEDLEASDVEGNAWTITADILDGFVKFRKNDEWGTNWGDVTFPTGIGLQDGDNIPVVAGNYNITLNTATGDYAFNSTSSTANILSQNSVKVFPNPVSSTLNVHIQATELENNVTVRVLDTMGKVLQTQTHRQLETLTLNVSNYPTGVYYVQIYTDSHLVGKKITIAK